MHNCYAKMHNFGTLRIPYLRSQISKDKKILSTRLSFEVKITDVQDYYEIKVRMCADRSRMVQGVDFSISYTPTVNSDSLRLIIIIAASKGKNIIFIDASNTFQKKIISDPNKVFAYHSQNYI